MTEQLKLKIQESLSNKDYHTIYEVFVNNGLSFTDLLVFYKKNDVTILSDDKFWNSHLVHYYLAEILNSDIKINFLKSYFENESYNNDGLNEHLIIICKDDYIKHFKLWSAFKKPLFWASFRKISEKDTELAKIRRELEIVLHSQKRIQTEEKKDEQYFLHFTIGDLLLGFTLYYYEFKQQPHVLDNKSWQTMIEVTVLTVLDRIFLLHKCKSSMQFGFKNNSELQEYFAKNKAPHHIVDKKNSNNNINKKFNVIYSLIERAIAQTIFRNQIQLYLCGFAEFESINDNKGKLSTNNRYRLFQINNAKSTPEEYYFSNLRVETIPTKPPIKTDITSIVNTLNFYGFPTTITVNGFNIEIEKVIKLLKYFSVYKGNEEKGFINNYQTFIFNKGDEKFIELFGGNESITIFEFDKLIENISTYFNWNNSEAIAIVSLLTFDLNEVNFPLSWVSKPFIKLNGQILWLGSFLKDRRWDNILINKLKQDYGGKSLVNILSLNFELEIQKLFEAKGFKTLSGIKFKSSNGQCGDFDLLAFKNKYLFVGEAKSGNRSDDFYHSVYMETVRLEGSAAEQLEKSLFNIKEDWKNIKVKLEIPDVVNFHEIIIIPIVITDYFEGDMQLYKEKYRKTTLLELDVLFKNKKKDLLAVYQFMRHIIDRNNPKIKKPTMGDKNWDIWQGKDYPDLQILLNNIDNNEIWKNLEEIWDFPDVKFSIE